MPRTISVFFISGFEQVFTSKNRLILKLVIFKSDENAFYRLSFSLNELQ